MAGLAVVAALSVRSEARAGALTAVAARTRSHSHLPIEVKPPVKIRNLRLERASALETEPSSTLTFDMVNAGPTSITNIVFEMSVVSKTQPDDFQHPGFVLIGPVKLRTTFVLDPGYTVHYELRLTTLPEDCECLPRVTVFSARSVDTDASSTSDVVTAPRRGGE